MNNYSKYIDLTFMQINEKHKDSIIPVYDKIKSIKDILIIDNNKKITTIDVRTRNIEKETLKIEKE